MAWERAAAVQEERAVYETVRETNRQAGAFVSAKEEAKGVTREDRDDDDDDSVSNIFLPRSLADSRVKSD
jgi:hypothetical protein